MVLVISFAKRQMAVGQDATCSIAMASCIYCCILLPDFCIKSKCAVCPMIDPTMDSECILTCATMAVLIALGIVILANTWAMKK